VVAIQTGTASACGVGTMLYEKKKKKERRDNKPMFLHVHLRGRNMR
jgi:hypothetical protein